MALITKMLDIAVNDAQAGRITIPQMLSIFQEAIDNGDILEPDNKLCVIAHVIPLVDAGALQTSEHIDTYLSQGNAEIATLVQEMRNRQSDSN